MGQQHRRSNICNRLCLQDCRRTSVVALQKINTKSHFHLPKVSTGHSWREPEKQLTDLLRELQLISEGPTKICCDNIGSIKLSKNPIFHSRTKHFDVHFHFRREKIQEGLIEVLYTPNHHQPADILTKPLGRLKFANHRSNDPNSQCFSA